MHAEQEKFFGARRTENVVGSIWHIPKFQILSNKPGVRPSRKSDEKISYTIVFFNIRSKVKF